MMREIQPEYSNAAGSWRDQPQEHVDRRGFARTVGTKQSHDFALVNVERNIIHGDKVAKPFREIAAFNDGLRHGHASGHLKQEVADFIRKMAGLAALAEHFSFVGGLSIMTSKAIGHSRLPQF